MSNTHPVKTLSIARGMGLVALLSLALFTPPANAAPTAYYVQGCVEEFGYDIRHSGDYTMIVRLRDASGSPHLIAFGDKNVQYVSPGTGTPLVSTPATLHWTRIMETLERGAAAKRQVQVAYDSTGHVFGLSVIYYGICK
jgi:hypothetical protein